jgi:molecular chaperone Hsp33
VQELLNDDTEIKMDCQFCNTQYRFGAEEALGLFGIHVS